jgi:hypothetical protein
LRKRHNLGKRTFVALIAKLAPLVKLDILSKLESTEPRLLEIGLSLDKLGRASP